MLERQAAVSGRVGVADGAILANERVLLRRRHELGGRSYGQRSGHGCENHRADLRRFHRFYSTSGICGKIARMQSTQTQLDPGPILQTAFAFWSSKVLLTAVQFDVFTKLGDRRMTGAELGEALGLHSRGISDFFDALV